METYSNPADMPLVYHAASMPHGSAGLVRLVGRPFEGQLNFLNQHLGSPSRDGSKTFLLNRSVFDLVNRHRFLELSDPQLLGWYLSLSPEARKVVLDEGGLLKFLQRHPALETTRTLVYVKCGVGGNFIPQQTMSSNVNKPRRPTVYGVTLCETCGSNCLSDTKKCRRCYTPIPDKKSTGGYLGETYQPGQGPIDHQLNVEDSFQTAPNSSHLAEDTTEHYVQSMSTLWEGGTVAQKACSSSSSRLAVYNDSLVQASWSLDVELDRQRQEGKSSSKDSALQREASPEFHSLNNGTEWNDTSVHRSVEPECDGSLVAPGGSPEPPGQTPPGTAADAADCSADYLFSPPVNEYFHSIMSESMMWRNGEGLSPNAGEVHLGAPGRSAVTSDGTSKSNPSAVEMTAVRASTADASTSAMPPVTYFDVSVCTDLSLAGCHEAATQTQSPATMDKNVITQVHMADLDYLAEEFIRLRLAEDELKGLKAKLASAGGVAKGESRGVDGGCDCDQRAKNAELSLLALQYSMCQQHCWRCYCTTPVGNGLAPGPEFPPANLARVLQTLETDYKEMRDKVLAGTPLDQLTPLSVGSQTITMGVNYVPAQLIGDALGNVSSGSVSQLQRPDTGAGDGDGGPPSINAADSQDGRRRKDPAPHPKVDSSKPERAVTLLPKQAGASLSRRPGEKQTGSCKELNFSEAWYDAEEDLASAGPAAVSSATPTVKKKDGSAKEVEKSSFLLVTDLPSDVTEDDVMLWFEKYHASEVSIYTFSNNIRVAMITVSGLQSAEGAVREMNGCSMQDHTLHVEHLQRRKADTRSQDQALVSTHRPGPSGTAPKPQSSKTISSNTTVKLLERRKVLCNTPTATGTCVPQHYGTMGSFDTLMARLRGRHPELGRQRIVDALLELRALHRGVLSGLPLTTIADMTSDLLLTTRP